MAAHRVDLDLDDSVGRARSRARQLVGGRHLGHVVVPDEGGAVGGEDVLEMAEKSLLPTQTPVMIAPSVTVGSGSGAR